MSRLVVLLLLVGCPKSGSARLKALPDEHRYAWNNCVFSPQVGQMPRFAGCLPLNEERQLECLDELRHEYADLADLEARRAWLKSEGCVDLDR